MARITTYLSILAMNVNGFKSSIKMLKSVLYKKLTIKTDANIVLG
jgi:hypothetical protein